MRHNENICILPADKGGGTVILQADQYGEACAVHLNDVAYEQIESFGTGTRKVHLTDPRTKLDVPILNQDFETSDVTDRLQQLQCSRLSNLLSKLSVAHQLTLGDVRLLGPASPYAGVVPRFYGLLKLHKLGPLSI